MRRRAVAAFVLALISVAAVSAPAFAGDAPPPTNSGGRISVDGGLLIGSDEHVEGLVVSVDGDVRIDGVVDNDVYVASGDARISGRVHKDVVVIGGDAIISGEVDGNVVVIGGRAIVNDSDAFVGGDIRSTDEPHVARGAKVTGSIDKLGFNGLFGSLMFTLLLFLWLAVTISGAIVGLIFVLVFPRAAAASTRASSQVGSSVAWGLGVGLVGPVLAVVAVASLVGLPFGLGLGAGLIALAGLGYVASSLSLGRLMVKATHPAARVGAFFAGFGILRFIALIPVLGGLVGFAAVVYGIGILANAAWRASREVPAGGIGPAASVPPTPGDEEPPPAPGDEEPPTEPDVPPAADADLDTDATDLDTDATDVDAQSEGKK